MIDSFGENNAGKVALLEWRNNEGKAPLHLAIENSRNDVADYLVDNFGKDLDYTKIDYR